MAARERIFSHNESEPELWRIAEGRSGLLDQARRNARVTATVWEALRALPVQNQIFFAFALLIAFAFEFINGFHDTANAVTTVIYTKTLNPTPAVLYSGLCNFLGVLLGGTAVAFSIVNLLPVDLLIESAS